MKRLTLMAALLVANGEAHAADPPALVERGRYLAIAGDCTACHTAPGGTEFAGGYALATPLGPIIATNITPSKRFGIGSYSEAQFAAALREGIRADGAHLYPAMPYTAYRLLSDDDVHALYAYFMTGVTPVERPAAKTRLPFPFNMRAALTGWNLVSLKNDRFTPDNAHDARWNRGAYLVEGLGHCSVCHSPRNFLMQERAGKSLAGARLGAWYAPNITSDVVSGIGAWPTADLVVYLRTGIAAGRARAAGGMAEVVEHSLSQLTSDDLLAIATYLKTVPAVASPDAPFRRVNPASVPVEPGLRGERARPELGAVLYSGLCASCHGSEGGGSSGLAFPGLAGNATVASGRPDNLVAVILDGVDRRVGQTHAVMPGFGAGSYVQSLTDAEVAAVASFVRARFGPGGAVSAADVATARAGGPRSHLPELAGGMAAALLIAGLLAWGRRRRA